MKTVSLHSEWRIVLEQRITGVMIYYYFVCKRKLWYFCHEINMEDENEDVMLGKLLDDTSYQRDEKHININNVINIDFIKEHGELHEIKKSKANVIMPTQGPCRARRVLFAQTYLKATSRFLS